MARNSFIDEAGRRRISQAIKTQEARTRGEIVAVVTERSDDYSYIPTLWAALAALSVPLPAIWFPVFSFPEIYAGQLFVFIAVALVLRLPAIMPHIIPASVKRQRAHRVALDQFLAQNLHTTPGRTGVLIFISVLEHYCEVIADEGIHARVAPDVWDDAVASITSAARAGSIVDGFVSAIETCGDVLAAEFPPDGAEDNSLPDHLIVLEG